MYFVDPECVGAVHTHIDKRGCCWTFFMCVKELVIR